MNAARRTHSVLAIVAVTTIASLSSCGGDDAASVASLDTSAAASQPTPEDGIDIPAPVSSASALDIAVEVPVETSLETATLATTNPATNPATNAATSAATTSTTKPAVTTTNKTATPGGRRCLIKLHGLTGRGQPTQDDGTVTLLQPQGNGTWPEGGFGWIYYSDDRLPGTGYDQARASILSSIDAVGNCGQIIVYGFSNGGAMAAKLYCRGESFGGRMVGYIVDDPVTDAGVDRCSPAAGVKVAVFHSRFMEDQVNGSTTCRPGNTWVCENNVRYRLSDYDARIGVVGVIAAVEHDAGPYQPIIDGWWK
jgi:hypothetical protein